MILACMALVAQIVKALSDQANVLALTSRAFFNGEKLLLPGWSGSCEISSLTSLLPLFFLRRRAGRVRGVHHQILRLR
jgi:hypothetical protein